MELLEREPCRADLSESPASVQVHGGCTALLTREAGIGTTAWLQEFAQRQRGVRVLWGVCDAPSTSRPLAPLHDIARQTQDRLSAMSRSILRRDAV